MTLTTYLNTLFTLLLAYAIAGSVAVTGVPAEEKRGSDPLACVEIPLTTALQYYWRAKKFSEQIPHGQALAYVRRRGEGDREQWVEKFRNGGQSLGKTMQAVFEMRDAAWLVPGDMKKAAADPNAGKDQGGGKGGGKGDKGKAKGDPRPSGTPNPGSWANQFPNGSKLCRDYQHDRRTTNPCPHGKHLCAVVLKNGRVRGQRHPASKCTSKKKV